MGISEKALTGGEDILKYIPQRPPVVMVDSFFGIDGNDSESGFTVPADSIFCRGGVLDECALIENMAQTMALTVGYRHAEENRPVPVGMIGAVSNFAVKGTAGAGDVLRTRATVVTEMMNVTLAEVKVTKEGREICSCQLKIFIQPEGE